MHVADQDNGTGNQDDLILISLTATCSPLRSRIEFRNYAERDGFSQPCRRTFPFLPYRSKMGNSYQGLHRTPDPASGNDEQGWSGPNRSMQQFQGICLVS